MMHAHRIRLPSEMLELKLWLSMGIQCVDSLSARDIRRRDEGRAEADTNADERAGMAHQPGAEKAERYGKREPEKRKTNGDDHFFRGTAA